MHHQNYTSQIVGAASGVFYGCYGFIHTTPFFIELGKTVLLAAAGWCTTLLLNQARIYIKLKLKK